MHLAEREQDQGGSQPGQLRVRHPSRQVNIANCRHQERQGEGGIENQQRQRLTGQRLEHRHRISQQIAGARIQKIGQAIARHQHHSHTQHQRSPQNETALRGESAAVAARDDLARVCQSQQKEHGGDALTEEQRVHGQMRCERAQFSDRAQHANPEIGERQGGERESGEEVETATQHLEAHAAEVGNGQRHDSRRRRDGHREQWLLDGDRHAVIRQDPGRDERQDQPQRTCPADLLQQLDSQGAFKAGSSRRKRRSNLRCWGLDGVQHGKRPWPAHGGKAARILLTR